jgi:CubicO group peptidase (beta-lactamase class C family)
MSDDALVYLVGPPVPRNTACNLDEVKRAVQVLVEAATVATRSESPSGPRIVPGLSIAVVFRDSNGVCTVVYCDGLGVKSVKGTPARPGADTLFPCASLSKPVSATLLAKMKVAWDQVVYQRNGEPYALPAAPPISLRQWLSHTSGLPDHAGDLIEDMNPSMSRDDIVQKIMQYQTGVFPGEFEYTNFGFTMGCLGAMHGLPDFKDVEWETFSGRVLQDLGMKSSTYAFTSAYAGAADRVFPHKGMPLPQHVGWAWEVVDQADERDPSRQAPAGGLISSARDMAVFLTAHLNGTFGDYPPRKPTGYALGWNVLDFSGAPGFANAKNVTSFSHSGAFTLGASTCVRIDPGMGVGIAILTNGEPAGVPEFLTRIFFNQLYAQPIPQEFKTDGKLDYAKVLAAGRELMVAAVNAKTFENDRRFSHATRLPIPAALGQGEVFRGNSPYYGCDVVIERNENKLVLTMGMAGGTVWSFPLRLIADWPSHLTFIYDTKGENAVGPSSVRLLRRDGKFPVLIDQWLNQAPAGTNLGTGVGMIQSSIV